MDNVQIIDAILTELACNQAKFLAECGISRSCFTDLKSGRVKKISRTIASKIVARYPQFSLKWLMTGEGDMHAPNAVAPIFNNSGDHVNNHQSVVDKELIGLLKEKDKQIGVRDEQINRLLTIIERMQS